MFSGESVLLADGFDEAFIGTIMDAGVQRAVYDRVRMCRMLMDRDGMSYEDADEFILYNVEGSGGEGLPVYATLVKSMGLRHKELPR